MKASHQFNYHNVFENLAFESNALFIATRSDRLSGRMPHFQMFQDYRHLSVSPRDQVDDKRKGNGKLEQKSLQDSCSKSR